MLIAAFSDLHPNRHAPEAALVLRASFEALLQLTGGVAAVHSPGLLRSH